MHDVDKICPTRTNQFNSLTYTQYIHIISAHSLMPRNCVFESFGLLEFNHKIFNRINEIKCNV